MTLEEIFKRTVFLVGAGASKDAGCKLSSEMLDSLRQEIAAITPENSRFYSNKDNFDEIYHFILASLNYQATLKGESPYKSTLVNIEDFVMVLRQLIDKEFIIPYPLIGNWNAKILRWEILDGSVFERFKEFITLLLVNQWTLFDADKAADVMRPVREVLNSSEDIKVNFFSLNYDLIFETTFNTGTSKLLDTGFSEKTVSDDSIRFWSKDFNDKNTSTKVNLFKLHGSLDWQYDIETEEISIKDNIFDGREPLMIFGSSAKMLSFDPFLYILSSLRTSLEEATVFVVIGYSFHDKHINNLLIQQLSQNTFDDFPKRLLVVDPGRKDRSEADFADELKSIQGSKSINDIINFRQISPERIKLLPLTASEFYAAYFGDEARLLGKELDDAEKADRPFG